jgi:para-nitrobenzyl esterase
MEDKDYAVSEQMVSYLCNFARTGDPNGEDDLPNWEASAPQQKKVLMIGEGETRMAKPSMLKMIITMLTNKAVGE